MEQYIPKSALVAWIKKKKIPFKRDIEDGNYPTYLCALMDFEDLLDTLEVKEVDFEKIWKEYFKYRGDVATVNIKHLAKYFFELGMSVSNKAQKGE